MENNSGVMEKNTETKDKQELAKVYDPKDIEEKWYAYWIKHKLFHAEVNPDKEPFSIVIPPPNVTGALHIGHAYNNAVQDIYVRFKRLQGFETLWSPGTDHAGIATQTVVEKQIKTEGKDRKKLGREAFVQEVWNHKVKYRDRIIKQLQKMGCSCDWDREWFTMDETLSRAVTEVFVHLYEKGWIYKGHYIVNWCPYSQSAISDEEVEYKEVNGKLWYFRYPVKDSDESVVVATTRPETMLGDTGVAVNPEDPRYKHLIGKTVVLPIVGREIPLFSDPYVDKEFGTGAVKVTPSHDPNDFQMGKRHQLEFVNIMKPDATLNNNVPVAYQNLERFAARKQVLEDMQNLGLLVKTEDHVNRVGYSQRGNVPIEPLVSEQWFLKMSDLAKPALEAVQKGDIRFHPEKWYKTYEHWMTSIRDWCISRQLWWGHRIPAYYDGEGKVYVARTRDEAEAKAGTKNLKQDEDVLDTWFSSWLVPFSSMGWPEKTKETDYFFPTNLLVTGPDIIFFWVARMIMASLEFTGKVPFHRVYFNGIVRDEKGRKMSKSLGNGIDPIDVIDKFSADALRFTLVDLSAEGQDIHLAEKHFEIGRNFSNKVWNAFRLLWMHRANVPEARPELPDPKLINDRVDRWILSRYFKAVAGITDGLESFKLHDAMQSVYHFFWTDYCDWYLEFTKDRLYNADDAVKKQTLSTALYIMEGILKLLHPITPFITEEIWQKLEPRHDGESIMTSGWPSKNPAMINDQIEMDVELLKSIIVAVRNIRSEMNVPPSKKTDLILVAGDDHITSLLIDAQEHIRNLSRTEQVTVSAGKMKPKLSASAVVSGVEIYVPLEGIIDVNLERQRLQKEIDRLEGQIQSIDRKLMNNDFIAKAPPQVLEKEKAKRENFKQTIDKLQGSLKQMD